MRLTFGFGNAAQVGVGEVALPQHRPGDGDVIAFGQLLDHACWCVGNGRQSPCKLGKRFGLDLLDQTTDDVVEQGDVLAAELDRAVEEKAGDAAQCLGALGGRSMLNDVFQFWKQRGGHRHHKTCRNSP
jgi:hypothetical protein